MATTTCLYVHANFNNIYRKLFGYFKGGGSISAVYVNNNIDSLGVLVHKNFIVFKHV